MGFAILFGWLVVNYFIAASLFYRARRAEGLTPADARRDAWMWPVRLFGRKTA